MYYLFIIIYYLFILVEKSIYNVKKQPKEATAKSWVCLNRDSSWLHPQQREIYLKTCVFEYFRLY